MNTFSTKSILKKFFILTTLFVLPLQLSFSSADAHAGENEKPPSPHRLWRQLLACSSQLSSGLPFEPRQSSETICRIDEIIQNCFWEIESWEEVVESLQNPSSKYRLKVTKLYKLFEEDSGEARLINTLISVLNDEETSAELHNQCSNIFLEKKHDNEQETVNKLTSRLLYFAIRTSDPDVTFKLWKNQVQVPVPQVQFSICCLSLLAYFEEVLKETIGPSSNL